MLKYTDRSPDNKISGRKFVNNNKKRISYDQTDRKG